MNGRLRKYCGMVLGVTVSAVMVAIMVFAPGPRSLVAQERGLMGDTADYYGDFGTRSAHRELLEATEAVDTLIGLENLRALEPAPTPVQRPAVRRPAKPAEGFVASPEWEFDGFVAGGRDQEIKDMFTVSDLLYLTIGTQAGFFGGDRLDIYRRGDRINDPHTGRNLGFEVRKIAMVEISNRIDALTSSARVLLALEPIEIGDLVKRAE